LLEHNLIDAGSAWDNTQQLITQLQVIREAFVLRQAGPESSAARIAEDATNEEHAHRPFADDEFLAGLLWYDD